MTRIRTFLLQLWALVRSRQMDRDIDDEIASHLGEARDEYIRRGLSPEDAHSAALRSFGGVTQTKEVYRQARSFVWLDDLRQDLRYTIRTLVKSPRFTVVVVLTLALGIGANTAIFSIADAILFRTLPVRNPRDLVVLRQRGPAGDIFPFTSAAAMDLRHDVLAGLAAFRPLLNTHVSVNGEAELVPAQLVSGNYHAVLGRALTEQDSEPVAVISHGYWQRRFAGDPNVVGRVLEMQGRSFTIVGVTPREFFGTQPGRHIDVTAPLGAQTMAMPPNARWLYLIGRLAPGVSREQARAALRLRWAQLAAAGSLPPRPPVTLELDSGAQGLNELRRQFSVPLRRWVWFCSSPAPISRACAWRIATLERDSAASRIC